VIFYLVLYEQKSNNRYVDSLLAMFLDEVKLHNE